jgi:hypothetical protein
MHNILYYWQILNYWYCLGIRHTALIFHQRVTVEFLLGLLGSANSNLAGVLAEKHHFLASVSFAYHK